MWNRDNRIRFSLFVHIHRNKLLAMQAHYDVTNNNKKVNFELEGLNCYSIITTKKTDILLR